MKRILWTAGLILLLVVPLVAQEKVKNLILMIPDGTSSPVLSIARWYRYGTCRADNCRLAIDPHICGMVSSYNSDSPIGDSAPTGSTYATGYLSNSGFVATYPVSSGKARDLVMVDECRAWHPLVTLLEASRLMGKAVGLVVTSEFTHATPADFSAHTTDRDDKESIAVQMVHNHLKVVFGGGLNYLDPVGRKDGLDLFNVLRLRNYRLVCTREEFDLMTPADTLVYGLFDGESLPNDLDRDPERVPSLADMTKKAIGILSADPEGFFLLVEGSKIDWAAHDNDPVGIITEYLAFDDAVKEAINYANRDGHTAVVIVPDHGTSGISLGNRLTELTYDTLPLGELVRPLQTCTGTAEGITRLIRTNPESTKEILQQQTGIAINDQEQLEFREYIGSGNMNRLQKAVAGLIARNTFVGFTTHGHTGEDVMLAVYHPAGYRPEGVVENTRLHQYMKEILGIPDLDSLTAARYCVDTIALEGINWRIDTSLAAHPRLIIGTDRRSSTKAVVEADTDYITLYLKDSPSKVIPFNTVAIYVKPLKHFFVPRDIRLYLPPEI